jgi:hypothetical protein
MNSIGCRPTWDQDDVIVASADMPMDRVEMTLRRRSATDRLADRLGRHMFARRGEPLRVR